MSFAIRWRCSECHKCVDGDHGMPPLGHCAAGGTHQWVVVNLIGGSLPEIGLRAIRLMDRAQVMFSMTPPCRYWQNRTLSAHPRHLLRHQGPHNGDTGVFDDHTIADKCKQIWRKLLRNCK